MTPYLTSREVSAISSSGDAGELKEALEAGARFPAWGPADTGAAA
jgi:hypothetical protein